jgi:putative DNA primase/helicase
MKDFTTAAHARNDAHTSNGVNEATAANLAAVWLPASIDELSLIQILLNDPHAARAVFKKVKPLRRDQFSDEILGCIGGAVAVVTSNNSDPSPSEVARELGSQQHDVNMPRPEIASAALTVLRQIADKVPACVANESKGAAQKEALRLTRLIQTAREAELPALSDEPTAENFNPLAQLEKLDPQALTADLFPVLKLAPEMIPASLRSWLVDIAGRMSCPLEYPTVAALVSLSGVVGRQVAIRPKQHDNWTIPPNLWGGIVSEPGNLKTPATQEAMKPLDRLFIHAQEHFADELKEFLASLKVKKAQSKAAQSDLEKAARSADADPARLKELALQATAGEDDEKTGPTPKRWMVSDTTLEALCERLKENTNGLIIYRDELLGLLKSFEKQGHETDRAFYLEGWAGTATNYPIDRIGRGTTILPAVCLSIFGTVQPGPLARYIRTAATGDGADGFIQRFQLLVYPDPTPFQYVDRWPDSDAKNRAFAIFESLSKLDPAAIGAQSEDNEIPFLNFAPDAQEFFKDWLCELEARLRDGLESPMLTAHLAKYRSLMPSLALLFHLIEIANGREAGALPLQSAQMAAAWCDFLEQHARRIFHSATDGDLEGARTLETRIRAGLPNPFKISDIAKKGWANLGTTEEIERAVAILEDKNRVLLVEEPADSETGKKGGRPQRKVYVHPKIANPKERVL